MGGGQSVSLWHPTLIVLPPDPEPRWFEVSDSDELSHTEA